MSDQRARAIEYARKNRENFLPNLKQLVSIPSVSTSSDHKADMERAANMLAGHLKRIEMENVQIFPTTGHPVVFGE